MKDDRVYLEHILESINKILKFVEGISKSEFDRNILVQDAVIRNFEIIGEATKKISKPYIESNPDVPWQDMAGMRDKLIHDYLDVDIDILWRTIETDLPILKAMILRLL